jgi:hypothetical protein
MPASYQLEGPAGHGGIVRYRYFVTLGVKIDGGQVLTVSGRLLGPLAGARAEMGEPTRHRRVA